MAVQTVFPAGSLCHCTVGVGPPDAAAVKVTLAPTAPVWLVGWSVMCGGAPRSPKLLSPQHTTEPLERTPQLSIDPAVTLAYGPVGVGAVPLDGLLCPLELLPQHRIALLS